LNRCVASRADAAAAAWLKQTLPGAFHDFAQPLLQRKYFYSQAQQSP
jgi:hypothetical protein